MPFPIRDFNVTRVIGTAAEAVSHIIFTAPYDCEVVSVAARHATASTSGTMNLVKVASGTAVASGTTILSATMSNAGTANANVSGVMKTGIGDRVIPQGSSLGLLFAGTVTNLVGLVVTVVMRQNKKTV